MTSRVPIIALGAIILIPVMIVGLIQGAFAAIFGSGNSGGGSQPSHTAVSDIPADYLAVYMRAATVCPGLDWTVLAAIGKIESDHGRDNGDGVHSGENHAGAGVISGSVSV